MTLINDYPRAMGHPMQDRFVYNQEERDAYVAYYIAKCPVYISVYKFLYIDQETQEPDRKSAWIDKIFLEFDDGDLIGSLLKVHRWCVEKGDFIHRFHFSGRGIHAFIFTDPMIQNKENAVRNFQRWIKQELDIDLDVVGCSSTSRIFRYPNSFHFEKNRFCIPIPSNIVNDELTYEMLVNLSQKQQFCDPWFGSSLLSLKEWDTEDLMFEEPAPSADYDLSNLERHINIDYKEFPPCVQNLLREPDTDDYGKFLLILYLKDQIAIKHSFESQEIVSILKRVWCEGEFDHFFGDGMGNWPQRQHGGHRGTKFVSIMSRDYYMPNCEAIRERHYYKIANGRTEKVCYCPFKCGRNHPIYD